MMDAKELVFNAVRSPNVLANSLPDHGPAQRPSINMITVCISGEGEGEQGWPSPFMIEYVPTEAAVRFAGIDAPPAPLVIDIPAWESYSDDRVPWTYEGGVGNLEQRFGMNVDLNRIRPSKTAVRAFDGSRREVKFIVEERIITVKGEEDYAIYKEMAVPYISVGDDENLPFHSVETISVIRDYGEVRPSRADRMIGKVLLRHNYIPGTRLGARGQGISRPIEVEEYKHRRSTSDGPSSDFDDTTDALPTVYAVTEEIPSGVHIRPAQENEELNNWTSVLRYLTVIADVLHSNPNLRHVDSNPSEECLGEPGPIYFGGGLDEDSPVLEIEESLRPLEDRQLTSLEPTEEINVGTGEEPRILKIGTSLDPTQRVRMIDFLT
ncbi:hypothetical protein CRG98_039274, partial [Punica granatum]